MPDPFGGKEAMRQSTRALIGAVIGVCCAQHLTAAESGSRWWPFGKKDEAQVAQPSAVGATSLPQQTNLPPIPNTTVTAPSAKSLSAAPPAAAATAPAAPPIASTPPAQTAGPLGHGTELPVAADDAEKAKKERWMLSSPKGKVSWPHLNKDLSKGGPLFSTKKKEEDPTRNSWVEKTPAPPKPSPMKPVTDGAHKFSTSTKSAWHKTVDALTPGEPTPQPKASSPRIAKREVQPPSWKRMFGAKSELQQPQTVPEWMAQQRLDP
jgi:hypothetical protein